MWLMTGPTTLPTCMGITTWSTVIFNLQVHIVTMRYHQLSAHFSEIIHVLYRVNVVDSLSSLVIGCYHLWCAVCWRQTVRLLHYGLDRVSQLPHVSPYLPRDMSDVIFESSSLLVRRCFMKWRGIVGRRHDVIFTFQLIRRPRSLDPGFSKECVVVTTQSTRLAMRQLSVLSQLSAEWTANVEGGGVHYIQAGHHLVPLHVTEGRLVECLLTNCYECRVDRQTE